jgi:hypothetical protein
MSSSALLLLLLLLLQGGLWAYESMATTESAEHVGHILSAGFLASVSLCAAVGFVLYGGRLFLMLQRFPIESRGRKKKLREVGMVTSICAACFTFRWARLDLGHGGGESSRVWGRDCRMCAWSPLLCGMLCGML